MPISGGSARREIGKRATATPVDGSVGRWELARPGVVVDNGGVATRTEHPVLHGLAALVSVAMSVGLMLGLGTLLVTEGLGLGASTDAEVEDSTGGAQTMYLPKPEQTATRTGPLVSLVPGEQPESGSTGSAPPSGATSIVLSSPQTAVAPMEQIDLTGTYAGGEGAVLQVQRFEVDDWQDFPVTASVSGGAFSTYIQTSQPGPNRFRMADTDTGATSNEVIVEIG